MTIYKKILALALSAIMLTAMTACTTPKTENTTSSKTSEATSSVASASSDTAMTITDREGKVMTLPANIDKIISLAPSVTETLVSLGLADKLVAIDDYSKGITGISESLPTFNMMEPNTEQIIALNPDIIFGTGMSKTAGEDLFKPVTDTGILMTFIPSSDSIKGIKDDILFIGDATKTSDKAKAIVDDMTKKMDDIVAKITVPEQKIKVYFENSPAPSIYTFGTGTFLNEMIELLGAENIFADQNSWISASEEQVIAKNPDVIFTSVNFTDDSVGEILARNGFGAVNAVKNKQVFQIDANSSSRPNENIVLAFQQMANALYPEK